MPPSKSVVAILPITTLLPLLRSNGAYSGRHRAPFKPSSNAHLSARENQTARRPAPGANPQSVPVLASTIAARLDPAHPVYKALSEAEARYLNVPIMEVAAPFSVPSADELRTPFEGAGFRHTEIIPISHDVSFSSPERFVEITVLGGAAVVPELAEEDPTALIQAVVEETQAVVQRYSNGDIITFPMPAHIAIAHL